MVQKPLTVPVFALTMVQKPLTVPVFALTMVTKRKDSLYQICENRVYLTD